MESKPQERLLNASRAVGRLAKRRQERFCVVTDARLLAVAYYF